MLWLYIFFGIGVVFVVLIALAAAFERRQVWYFVPALDALPERLPAANAYANRAAGRVEETRFTSLGVFADGKSKLYCVRYQFFRAPEGDTLVMVGTGKIASVPVDGTWLYTLLEDGRCLVTLDNPAGSEVDFTGIIEEMLVQGVGFDGLLRRHQERIGRVGVPVVPWSATDALGDFRAFRKRRIERLVELGYAAFFDRDRTAWHYTPKGSIALAVRQYFKGMRREFVPDSDRAAQNRTGV